MVVLLPAGGRAEGRGTDVRTGTRRRRTLGEPSAMSQRRGLKRLEERDGPRQWPKWGQDGQRGHGFLVTSRLEARAGPAQRAGA